MPALHRFTNYIRYASFSKLVLASVLIFIGLSAIIAISVSNHGTATAAQDCNKDANAAIRCGVTTGVDFVTKYKQNPGSDLPAIYSAYGLTPDKIDDFGAHAVMGAAYKDGTIKVNGQVVATDAHSLGRQQKNGDHPVNIGDKTYYDGANSTAFASDGLPTLVLMNGDQFITGVITSCANPITGKAKTPPPKPSPVTTCKSLTAQLLGKAEDRTFKYVLDYSAEGGATLKTVDFDFGDGANSNGVTVGQLGGVQHTYAKEGSYTTVATLHFSIGDATKDVNCQVTVQASPTPVSTPPPVTPPSVPSTGPTDVLAGAIGVSSVSGAGYYWFRSRRTLIDRLLNR